MLLMLALLGCSGATEQNEAQTVGNIAPMPSASAILPASGLAPNGGSMPAEGGSNGGGGSGAASAPGGTSANAGGSGELGGTNQGGGGRSNDPPQSGGGSGISGASFGSSGGGSGGSGSGGTSGGSSGTSGRPTCTPKSWADACGARSCGNPDDGCGAKYSCGSCSGLTECTDAGVCAETCHSLALECGTHPAVGLDCGSCAEGQDCGVTEPGKCTTCAEAPNLGVCPAARPHLWKPCGGAPALSCLKPFGQDPSWWCCP